MNREIQTIRSDLQRVLYGDPWYGRSVFEILGEVDAALAFEKPNGSQHSLIELLYHMLTWAEFTQNSIRKDNKRDARDFDKEDWRDIDPSVHTWEKGLQQLKSSHTYIIEQLELQDDEWLNEIVDSRSYDIRFLLNGLIQHDIYHLGQIAYVNKLLNA